MASSIELDHDPETGAWCFVTSDRSNLLVHGYPDFETWWGWFNREAPAEAGSLRRRDALRAFKEAVAPIQSGCHCLDCRATRVREAGTAASRLNMMTPVKLIRDSGEVAGEVGADGRVRFSPRPPTYKQARTRYMAATGDDEAAEALEAMLAAVTMTVPDLDTIGSDWEPAVPVAAQAVEAAKPGELSTAGAWDLVAPAWGLVAPAWGLVAAAAVLTVLAGAAVLPRELSLAAVACGMAGVALFWRAMARK